MPNLEHALPSKTGDNEHLKVRVAGLVVSCPVSQDNPYDCPLHAVRLRPLRERFEWLDSRRPDQMRSFLDQHGECIVRKEQENHEPA